MNRLAISNIKKILIAMAASFAFVLMLFAGKAFAGQVDISFDCTDGSDCEALNDDDYYSSEHFDEGTEITINSDSTFDALYIKWEDIPTTWKLTAGGQSTEGGKNGFLHEYIKLPVAGTSATITIPAGGAKIADVYAYSGDVPANVQKWQPAYDRTDILLISAHADDEHIFLGSIEPTYTNGNRARVQVAYFCDFFQTEPFRNHEILDGLWESGVTHYPDLGPFIDVYSESLEEAEGQYNRDEGLGRIVSLIRRYKPQVLVTHDFNGEYGHGCHRLVASLTQDAIAISNDAGAYPDSANAYGVWDVPKTYIHLYDQGQITIPTREPLSDFGGRNALEVATNAFEKHVSQQGPTFWVDDEYEYSMARFGLLRSLVGEDLNGNDVMEHITSYDEQERQAKEAQTESQPEPETKGNVKPQKGNKLLIIIVAVIGAIVVVVVVLFIILSVKKAKRRKEAERRRRAARARARKERGYLDQRQRQNNSDRGEKR